jgi:hypothetical protein
VSALTPGGAVFEDSSFSASDVFTVDKQLRTPYVQIYNVNCRRSSARARRCRSATSVRSASRCSAIATSISSRRSGDAPYPDFVYINQFESTAHSRFNSLQASLRCAIGTG